MLNYETQRAQFEAFGANAYTLPQGTIFWMMNNAWPSVHWNLYDYFLKPGGGYFGTKKALEPLHILYDYKTTNIKVFNRRCGSDESYCFEVGLYFPALTLNYTNSVTMDFPANTSTTAMNISGASGLTTTYLIRLRLADSIGHNVSDNVYAYSILPDKLGTVTNWYHTSVSSYANLTGLNNLPSNTNLIVFACRQIGGWAGNGDDFFDEFEPKQYRLFRPCRSYCWRWWVRGAAGCLLG